MKKLIALTALLALILSSLPLLAHADEGNEEQVNRMTGTDITHPSLTTFARK